MELMNIMSSKFYVQQAIPFCGIEKEDCVAGQILKDESCLVPCTGLYADIADTSQTTMKGNNCNDLICKVVQVSTL